MEELQISSLHQLARQVRVDVALVSRLGSSGLSSWQSDRWAIRLGVHPVQIWPEWCWIWAGEPDLPDEPYVEHRNTQTVLAEGLPATLRRNPASAA